MLCMILFTTIKNHAKTIISPVVVEPKDRFTAMFMTFCSHRTSNPYL